MKSVNEDVSSGYDVVREEVDSSEKVVIIELCSVVSDVVSESVVSIVLIDDEKVVGRVDVVVVVSEKYFDDSNRISFVDVVLDCASEESSDNGD
jgi:hypothetical protein